MAALMARLLVNPARYAPTKHFLPYSCCSQALKTLILNYNNRVSITRATSTLISTFYQFQPRNSFRFCGSSSSSISIENGSSSSTSIENGSRGSFSASAGDPNSEEEGFNHSFVNGLGYQGKKSKVKARFVCNKCGFHPLQWSGRCYQCDTENSITKEMPEVESIGGGPGMEAARNKASRGSWVPRDPDNPPQLLQDVIAGVQGEKWRIPLSGDVGMEIGRVLGGGLVPGSLILVGGDPGVGKSTLLLQISSLLSADDSTEPANVLYVSGEESTEQIANRAVRLAISNNVYLYSNNVLEDIIDFVRHLKPKAVIVDSIQTVYLKTANGTIGSHSQVRECATALLQLSKSQKVPIFLVGHVTKAGDIAGPRVLEHIVDVVLYMEGEALHPHRLIRPVKNRFGSTNELGVLEMSRTGLQAVSNPTLLYVAGRNFEQQVPVGSTFTVVIDGSRPFLVETQALCSVGGEGRQCLGVEAKRVDMIIAVLTKQVGIPLDRGVLFMNAVGGVTLSETVGDLAIAVSICSSYFEKPVPSGMSFLGEIGLGGELRTATMMAKRVHELAKLRFKSCIVPDASINSLSLEGCEDFSVIGHNSLRSVIRDIFDVEF